MILDRIESVAKIIGVVAACFGVYTYYDALNQQKINRSLDYFDEFHSGRVFDARIAVGQMSYAWLDLQKQDGSDLTAEELAEVVLSDFSQAPGVIHFDLLVEFFLRAKKCIDSEGCDRETLIDLLCDDARTLNFYFLSKIAERQSYGERASDGLLCFATGFADQGCAASS